MKDFNRLLVEERTKLIKSAVGEDGGLGSISGFSKHLDAIIRLEKQRYMIELKKEIQIHTDVIQSRLDDIYNK